MTTAVFTVRDYDLAATLTSGQAFRWRFENGSWNGIIGSHWVQLTAERNSITAQATETISDWNWLADYLQLNVDLDRVLQTFPDDEPMRAAVHACQGLRLLRQDPWECLASFILSSTKQIVQIRQIVAQVCACFGGPVLIPAGQIAQCSFPSAHRVAALTEPELRACKMGFRAPYLLGAARKISDGDLDLAALRQMPLVTARASLMDLPGVGRKIADCVLLFAYGFQSAFPVDVWVMKALRELYFPGRKANLKRLQKFSQTHFGPCAGYAQQYLFHYMRTRKIQRESVIENVVHE
jgi:N-glycosylase/DNA lyase